MSSTPLDQDGHRMGISAARHVCVMIDVDELEQWPEFAPFARGTTVELRELPDGPSIFQRMLEADGAAMCLWLGLRLNQRRHGVGAGNPVATDTAPVIDYGHRG
jgi:hypothetical protein